jgi:hypothetical protein
LYNFIGVHIVTAGGGLGAATGIITTDTVATHAFLNFAEIVRWDMILGIGYIFIAIANVRDPELQNILPIVAVRLSIVDIEKGVLLYNHNWTKQESIMDEDMFSSMIYGTSMMLKEAIGRGNVREIVLEKARLVIRQLDEHPVACVLLIVSSSHVVRMALDRFARELETRMPQHEKGPVDVSRFSFVRELVYKHFPFVDHVKDSAT